MKPERWKQLDGLLGAALDRPATERASFLDRTCSGDEELRRELESLLISDGQAEAFIESIKTLQEAVSLSDGSPVYISALGYTYAVSGNKKKAQQTIEDFKRQLIK